MARVLALSSLHTRAKSLLDTKIRNDPPPSEEALDAMVSLANILIIQRKLPSISRPDLALEINARMEALQEALQNPTRTPPKTFHTSATHAKLLVDELVKEWGTAMNALSIIDPAWRAERGRGTKSLFRIYHTARDKLVEAVNNRPIAPEVLQLQEALIDISMIKRGVGEERASKEEAKAEQAHVDAARTTLDMQNKTVERLVDVTRRAIAQTFPAVIPGRV